MSLRYFHQFCPQGVESKYQLLVFDDDKTVFLPLTDFYHEQIGRVTEGTAISYVNVLEPFFYWLKHKSNYLGHKVSWNQESVAIKAAVKQYLQKQLGCKVRDQEQYEKVFATSNSSKMVNHFLAAIKSFYKTMIYLNQYEFSNPLINLDWDPRTELSGERVDRRRMPQIAGTEEPISYRRQTDSYFKIVNDKWVPEIIGEWDLPYRIYAAGEKSGWSLRDHVVTRFLFETGARISEIIGLTIGDYRRRSNLHELSTFNKGSYRRRIKFIKISPETLKLLIRYVNTERRKFGKNKVKFEILNDDEQLFISERGTPYKYNAFYNNWTNVVLTAQIKLNPHKARHWFVTNMLREIYETAASPSDLEQKKKQLIEYMKWREAETLNVYEHYFNEEKFRGLHEELMKNYQERELSYKTNKKTIVTSTNYKILRDVDSNSFEEDWLNELYEGLDD